MTHASRVKYWRKKLSWIEGANHYTIFHTIWLCNSLCEGISSADTWVMSDFVYITWPLRFQRILLHCHGYACDCTWFTRDLIEQICYLQMLFYSPESIPIAKKSVPTRIETQMRGFTKDKAVSFPGWHHNIMMFVKTITSTSRDNGRPDGLSLVIKVNHHVAKRVYLV